MCYHFCTLVFAIMAHMSSHNNNIIRWNLWNHQSYIKSQINTFAFYVIKFGVYTNDEYTTALMESSFKASACILFLRIIESLQQKDSYLFFECITWVISGFISHCSKLTTVCQISCFTFLSPYLQWRCDIMT